MNQLYLNQFVEKLIEDLIDVSKKKILMKYMSKALLECFRKELIILDPLQIFNGV